MYTKINPMMIKSYLIPFHAPNPHFNSFSCTKSKLDFEVLLTKESHLNSCFMDFEKKQAVCKIQLIIFRLEIMHTLQESD